MFARRALRAAAPAFAAGAVACGASTAWLADEADAGMFVVRSGLSASEYKPLVVGGVRQHTDGTTRVRFVMAEPDLELGAVAAAHLMAKASIDGEPSKLRSFGPQAWPFRAPWRPGSPGISCDRACFKTGRPLRGPEQPGAALLVGEASTRIALTAFAKPKGKGSLAEPRCCPTPWFQLACLCAAAVPQVPRLLAVWPL